MKIEWVEEKFPDLSGHDGVFNKSAKAELKSKFMPRKIPMIRTCHNDLVPAAGCMVKSGM